MKPLQGLQRATYEERFKVELIEEDRKRKKIKPYTKIIVSGNVIEVYQMDRAPRNSEGKLEKNENAEDRVLEGRKNSTRRARNTFRRLCLANFSNHSKFITLTFKNDVRDVKQANKEYKKFIQRLRYHYKAFKYITVIEFQDKNRDGVVHYHMLSDLPYIPNKKLAEIWGNGFVKINDISNVDNVGAYMVKYMLKDFEDPRLMGLKSYQTSKGLERPREYKGRGAELILQTYDLGQKKEVFSGSYPSEHNGLITYKEFNLNRL